MLGTIFPTRPKLWAMLWSISEITNPQSESVQGGSRRPTSLIFLLQKGQEERTGSHNPASQLFPLLPSQRSSSSEVAPWLLEFYLALNWLFKLTEPKPERITRGQLLWLFPFISSFFQAQIATQGGSRIQAGRSPARVLPLGQRTNSSRGGRVRSGPGARPQPRAGINPPSNSAKPSTTSEALPCLSLTCRAVIVQPQEMMSTVSMSDWSWNFSTVPAPKGRSPNTALVTETMDKSRWCSASQPFELLQLNLERHKFTGKGGGARLSLLPFLAWI